MSYDDEDRRREYNREQDRRNEERARQRREDDERARQRREDDERARQRREDDEQARQRREDDENSRLERERRDRDSEEGLAAIRKGDLAGGAMKLGMMDWAINYMQSQSLRDAEVAGDNLQSPSLSEEGSGDYLRSPSLSEEDSGDYLQSPSLSAAGDLTDTEVTALSQLDAFGASQDPMVLSILRDPSLTSQDKLFFAVATAISRIEEEIKRETQNQAELDTRIWVYTEEMVRASNLNIEKTLLRLRLEQLDAQKSMLQMTMQQLLEESNERARKAFGSKQG